MKYFTFIFYWAILAVVHGDGARNITLLSEKTFSLQLIEYTPPVQTEWGKIVDKRRNDLPWADAYEVVKSVAKGEKGLFEKWYRLHSKDFFADVNQARKVYEKHSSHYGSEDEYKKCPVSIERRHDAILGASVLTIGRSKFGIIYLERKGGTSAIAYQIEGGKWLISKEAFQKILSLGSFDAFAFSSAKELYEKRYAVKNSQGVFVPTEVLQGSQLSLSRDKRKVLE